jgi:hypothetical protein
MRPIFTIPLLGLMGLFLVYGSVIAGEAVSTTGPMLFLRNDVGVPITLVRVAILSVTALPIAYLTGYGLTRWFPASSRRIILMVAVLYALVIGLLQFNVYKPSVLGASVLKVLFVVLPLALVAYRHRPERTA